MTEQEWNACRGPGKMLLYLMDLETISDRKFRLFSTACVRRIWHFLGREGRNAIEVTERFVDGEATDAQRVAAGEAASDVAIGMFLKGAKNTIDGTAGPHESAVNAAWIASAYGFVNPLAVTTETANAASKGNRRAQLAFLRDIFGPLPFRSIHVEPACRNPSVVGLATAIYEERSLPNGHLDNVRLAVLGDALEEAGFTDADILAHLRRQDAAHVRGCWPIDLILNKQ